MVIEVDPIEYSDLLHIYTPYTGYVIPRVVNRSTHLVLADANQVRYASFFLIIFPVTHYAYTDFGSNRNECLVS